MDLPSFLNITDMVINKCQKWHQIYSKSMSPEFDPKKKKKEKSSNAYRFCTNSFKFPSNNYLETQGSNASRFCTNIQKGLRLWFISVKTLSHFFVTFSSMLAQSKARPPAILDPSQVFFEVLGISDGKVKRERDHEKHN